MTVIKLVPNKIDPELEAKAINELKGKKFFAVYLDEQEMYRFSVHQFSEQEIIYCCHLLSTQLLNGDISIYPEGDSA